MDYTLENKAGVEVEFEVDYNFDPGEEMIMNPPDKAYPGSPASVEITNLGDIEEFLGRKLSNEETESMEEDALDYHNEMLVEGA